MSNIKQTPFFDIHCKYGARMIDFFGWRLPLEYQGSLKEAVAARSDCVLFDTSHMGQIRISGSKAEQFLQSLTPNDMSRLKPLAMQYNLFTNHQGAVIDDFMMYKFDDSFLCVVNASRKDKVLEWLDSNKTSGVDISDESANTALLSLQGPKSQKLLEQAVGFSLDGFDYLHFIRKEIKGIICLISRSGYTGEKGYEIYCAWEDACSLWNLIVNEGNEFSLVPAGLGARDILRIEAGYPLYGNDIDETTNIIEASLGWVIKGKEHNFIGKDKILEVKGRLSRKRIGFIMQDKGVARCGYSVYNSHAVIGKVTSGTYSPNLNKFIGMAYVDIDFTNIGTAINIGIRNKLCRARIVSFPFVPIRVRNGSNK